MATDPAELKARVLAFLRGRRAPLSILEDEDGRSATLLDAPAGKSLRLRWDQLAQVEERSTRDHPEPYLLLLFEDGRQVALADVGFAFAPALHNSGPLPELPRTFCFRDFGVLASGIEQLLAQEGRRRPRGRFRRLRRGARAGRAVAQAGGARRPRRGLTIGRPPLRSTLPNPLWKRAGR
jgi:hypothetical protein